jgi:hypothetical protein
MLFSSNVLKLFSKQTALPMCLAVFMFRNPFLVTIAYAKQIT